MGRKKPKRIPGIYNLCDRWCERCHLTAHCRLFSDQQQFERELEEQEAQQKADPEEFRDSANARFWDGMNFNFHKQLGELLSEARRNEIETPDVSAEDEAWKPRRPQKLTPLNVDAEAYSEAINEFLEHNHPDAPAQKNAPKPELSAEAARDLNDAFDVACWYNYFITVKLARACKVDSHEDEGEVAEAFDDDAKAFEIEDANRSARLALLGITRSMQAWTRLHPHFPEHSREILSFLLRLDLLRREVESKFPDCGSARLWIDIKAPE
ncbi:MAG TPA: hypothetical protein VEK08_25395 [Planctomycetota bacterium]|nr:hypothetical protein [Planctomycetota bacterium]